MFCWSYPKTTPTNLDDPEAVVLHAEGCVDDVCDAVFQHPLEGGKQVWIHSLDIIQTDAFVQQHLQKILERLPPREH